MSPDDQKQNGGDDFGAMLAEFEKENPAAASTTKKRKGKSVGETVRGRVVSIGAETAFVELGGKSEGMLELAELRDERGAIGIAVGDEIEAIVVEAASAKYDGSILLRKKLGRGKEASSQLQQAFELGIPVEGLVTGVNKGGVEVQVAGVRAFCPISQLELRHVEDGAAYVGRRLEFRITKYEDSERGRGVDLVLSRRVILDEEAKQKGEQLRGKIALGSILDGTVVGIKDFGAFVDLGGVEGMIHVSELGHARVAHPKDLLSVGQNIEVQVIRIEKSDDPKKPERIALSLKSLEADPWGEVARRFPDGSKVTGKVMRVEPFGAFVELTPGIEGLVHISQLGGPSSGGGQRLRHAKDAVKVGQAVEVKVLSVDVEKRRIALQIGDVARAAEEEQEAMAAFAGHKGQNESKGLGTFGDLLRGATQGKAQPKK